MRQQWQIDQAAKCGCKGTDELCPCQNVQNGPLQLSAEAMTLFVSFQNAMQEKMERKQAKHGDAWMTDDWEIECRKRMLEHIAKGDPLDVAIYAFFLWARSWRTFR